MLDKTSKLVLDKFIASGKGTSYICAFTPVWENESDILIDDLANSLDVDTEDLRATVRYLESVGLVEYQRTNKGKAAGFHLSHKGLNYKEFKHLDSMERWKERAIGFASGVILSVIAALLRYLMM